MKFLDKLFNPMSIAIVGASKNSKKIGHQILKNIISGEFNGSLYPINLKENRILGLKTYKSVLDVRRKIDVAIIAIPAQLVPEVLSECGQKKIQDVVIISAGFSEIGNQGKELEEKITEIAKDYQINILGPNCLGFINPNKNINASFAKSKPQKGSLSIISQSGALGSAILDWAEEKNIGFSYFLSIGNKANISEIDLLEYLSNDPRTKIILSYIEDTLNGRKLMETIKACKKPIILIKGGSTKKGQKAAASHTGALATSNKIFKSALKQSGAIIAENLKEAFNIVLALTYSNIPQGKKVAVITNAGGPGILATDEVSKNNLLLAKIGQQTQNKLTKILPPQANIKNPIDILGDADSRRYRDAIRIAIEDKNIDAIITLLTPQTATEILKTAQIIAKISQRTIKPIYTSFIGGRQLIKAKKYFQKNNIPNFDYPIEAIAVLEKITSAKKSDSAKINPINQTKKKSIDKILEKKPINFAFQIAQKFDLPTVNSEIVRSKEELNFVAKSVGYPLVLKTLSKKVIHKKKAGGVILDIRTKKELFSAYRKVSKKFGPIISLSPFISGGVELYIGAKRDPLFGPVVLFGVGGIYVESFNDTSARVFPLDKTEVLEMMEEILAKKILDGLDKNKIARLIIKTGELIYNFPEISEIDFNPVKATSNNLKILDSRIVLK